MPCCTSMPFNFVSKLCPVVQGLSFHFFCKIMCLWVVMFIRSLILYFLLLIPFLLPLKASSSPDSSNSKMFDHFVAMGFCDKLVSKVIQEHGKKPYFTQVWFLGISLGMTSNFVFINIQGKIMQIYFLKLFWNYWWVDAIN